MKVTLHVTSGLGDDSRKGDYCKGIIPPIKMVTSYNKFVEASGKSGRRTLIAL
jgi:hypothetical protein